MSSSDSLSARSSSCQQQCRYCASHLTDRHEVRTGTYRSSTFQSFLLLQLLDCLQHATVVGDAVHPGVLLVLFGVDVPQQLNDIDFLLFLWTFLLRRGPETKKTPRRLHDVSGVTQLRTKPIFLVSYGSCTEVLGFSHFFNLARRSPSSTADSFFSSTFRSELHSISPCLLEAMHLYWPESDLVTSRISSLAS